jgi:hypothetical protein
MVLIAQAIQLAGELEKSADGKKFGSAVIHRISQDSGLM